MAHVHLDFETRSLLNVQDVGAQVYAKHPSTDILCLSYCVGDDPVVTLTREQIVSGQHFSELYELVRDPASQIRAHNAAFEYAIWTFVMIPKYGAPHLPMNRLVCTAAKAAYMSLPRDLAGVARVLGLLHQKDAEGKKDMLKLSRPIPKRSKNAGSFWEPEDCPDVWERTYRYNADDVETERELDKVLPDLPKAEQGVWVLDLEINCRGVRTDQALIEKILGYIERTERELTFKFQESVDYAVRTPKQVAAFMDWLTNNGYPLPNCQKATILKVLKDETMPLRVRKALEYRQALAKISNGKYVAMQTRCGDDGYLRDILLYCAAITNRWGGRGVQLQNLPRGTVDSDLAIWHIENSTYEWVADLYPDLMGLFSSCVRGMLIPSPGCRFIAGDFSAIEARVLAWLAGQKSTLDVFRQGLDVYCHEASGIYDREITKKDKYERSVGKVAVLALGYQGGVNAFGTMAKGYSVDLAPAYGPLWESATDSERRKARSAYERYIATAEKDGEIDPLDIRSGYAADIIKQRFRERNPNIVKFWNDLEYAACRAVISGQKTFVGGDDRPTITFGMYRTNLLCKLPSGVCIVYPEAKCSKKPTPWGEEKATLSYRTQDSTTYQWVRKFTYGGMLAENITQAVSRDLLVNSMQTVTLAGYPIAFHVHDEIVTDVPNGFGSAAEFEVLAGEIPSWAVGLPMRVEAWEGARYKK